MSADELLDVNITRWAREASLTNIAAVLSVLHRELLARGLAGTAELLTRAAHQLAAVAGPPVGNPIPLTFRPRDVTRG